MPYQDHQIKEQSEVAVIQMNRAIMLYIHEKDYISSITLAGAAEEIFSRVLEEKGIATIYETVKESTNRYREEFGRREYSKKQYNLSMNKTRNLLKHRSESGYISSCFRMEAMRMLYRAISNYKRLFKDSNNLIDEYFKYEPYGALPLFPFIDSSIEDL